MRFAPIAVTRTQASLLLFESDGCPTWQVGGALVRVLRSRICTFRCGFWRGIGKGMSQNNRLLRMVRPQSREYPARSTCGHCGRPFQPKRRSAQFCSDAHRLAAHRASLGRSQDAPESPSGGSGGHETLKSDARAVATQNTPISETLRRPNLPKGIVADAQWPGMYRLVRPDGTLSDMVNLTRAKDALREPPE